MNENFCNGFIKRAQEYGLSAIEANDLYKVALDIKDLNKVPKPVAGINPLSGAVGYPNQQALTSKMNLDVAKKLTRCWSSFCKFKAIV